MPPGKFNKNCGVKNLQLYPAPPDPKPKAKAPIPQPAIRPPVVRPAGAQPPSNGGWRGPAGARPSSNGGWRGPVDLPLRPRRY